MQFSSLPFQVLPQLLKDMRLLAHWPTFVPGPEPTIKFYTKQKNIIRLSFYTRRAIGIKLKIMKGTSVGYSKPWSLKCIQSLRLSQNVTLDPARLSKIRFYLFLKKGFPLRLLKWRVNGSMSCILMGMRVGYIIHWFGDPI